MRSDCRRVFGNIAAHVSEFVEAGGVWFTAKAAAGNTMETVHP